VAITPHRRRGKSTGRADRKRKHRQHDAPLDFDPERDLVDWDEAERQAQQETHNERMYQAMLDKVQ
jgi:hypothetical protein